MNIYCSYITDAEVNTRGYKDRFGRVFFAIPLLNEPKEKGPKSGNASIPHAVTVTNDRYFFFFSIGIICAVKIVENL